MTRKPAAFQPDTLAEMERELAVERTRAGLKVARKLGRKGDQKLKMTASKTELVKKLPASGILPKNPSMSAPAHCRWMTAYGLRSP